MAQRGHAILFHLGGVAQGMGTGHVFFDGPPGQFQQGGKRAGFSGAQPGDVHELLGCGPQQAAQAGKAFKQAVGQIHHVKAGNAGAQAQRQQLRILERAGAVAQQSFAGTLMFCQPDRQFHKRL
ncbi:hypothetical protein D3C72_949490 [compost metagenome]